MECKYGSHAKNLIGTRKFQVHRKWIKTYSKAKGKFRLPVLLLVVFAAEQRLLNMHGCALTSPVISLTKTGKGDWSEWPSDKKWPFRSCSRRILLVYWYHSKTKSISSLSIFVTQRTKKRNFPRLHLRFLCINLFSWLINRAWYALSEFEASTSSLPLLPAFELLKIGSFIFLPPHPFRKKIAFRCPT